MTGAQPVGGGALDARLGRIAFTGAPPGPRVAEPQRGQHLNGGGLGTVIVHRDADQDVARRGLGVLGVHVEVALVIEDAGVLKLVLRILAAAFRVLVPDLVVGERLVGVTIQRLQVRRGRRRVEVPVAFLDVLAVVALGTGEAEETLLEDGVALVPERQPETKPAFAIAQAEKAVLTPTVGTAACVLVREVGPGVAVWRVVLAHRPPLPLGEVRAPAFPVLLAARVLGEAPSLGCAVLGHPHHSRSSSLTLVPGVLQPRRRKGRGLARWTSRWSGSARIATIRGAIRRLGRTRECSTRTFTSTHESNPQPRSVTCPLSGPKPSSAPRISSGGRGCSSPCSSPPDSYSRSRFGACSSPSSATRCGWDWWCAPSAAPRATSRTSRP